eukprot:1757413-Rhodomonas_salina.3
MHCATGSAGSASVSPAPAACCEGLWAGNWEIGTPPGGPVKRGANSAPGAETVLSKNGELSDLGPSHVISLSGRTTTEY